MSLSKLNVWLKDEECKPIGKKECGYVNIYHIRDQLADLELSKPVPNDATNVELEVPPGCYILQACVRFAESTGDCTFTDKMMVVVGCNQDLCINLIVPQIRTLSLRYVIPFIREAKMKKIPDREIVAAAQTIMVVGGITKEEMNQVMEPKRRCIKTTKVSGKKMEDNIKKILKEDEAILHIIRGLR
jgi:hypothetical protein